MNGQWADHSIPDGWFYDLDCFGYVATGYSICVRGKFVFEKKKKTVKKHLHVIKSTHFGHFEIVIKLFYKLSLLLLLLMVLCSVILFYLQYVNLMCVASQAHDMDFSSVCSLYLILLWSGRSMDFWLVKNKPCKYHKFSVQLS